MPLFDSTIRLSNFHDFFLLPSAHAQRSVPCLILTLSSLSRVLSTTACHCFPFRRTHLYVKRYYLYRLKYGTHTISSSYYNIPPFSSLTLCVILLMWSSRLHFILHNNSSKFLSSVVLVQLFNLYVISFTFNHLHFRSPPTSLSLPAVRRYSLSLYICSTLSFARPSPIPRISKFPT